MDKNYHRLNVYKKLSFAQYIYIYFNINTLSSSWLPIKDIKCSSPHRSYQPFCVIAWHKTGRSCLFIYPGGCRTEVDALHGNHSVCVVVYITYTSLKAVETADTAFGNTLCNVWLIVPFQPATIYSKYLIFWYCLDQIIN